MAETSSNAGESSTSIERRGIDVIRGLAMDAPHAARSGHQGTAMALAPLAHVLFTRVMRYDASAPDWADRDRFVLSGGHASILQYAMLYLTGYGLSLDDIKDFRQWGSQTPGHPEVHHTAGIEVTTGPLGQGVANAVGMALAERWLRARYGAELTDHHVFALCGDGDLAEGISHEAASLAGHQGLGRLICVYDDNHITIDGATELSLSDDAAKRFAAYGWHVQDLGDAGEDLDAIEAALLEAKSVEDAPSLVVLRTHIAFPSPDQTDDPHAHGYSLLDDEISATKAAMGIPDQPFWVPEEVVDYYRAAGSRGADERSAWQQRYDASTADRSGYDAAMAQTGVAGWHEALPAGESGSSVATRKASAACLNAAVEGVPAIIAGAADLTGNTGTEIKGAAALSSAEPGGRQMYYGVREHAMGAIMNGMALHGGVVPVGGTFLVFSDYMRPAVRLAALSRAKVIYSWTHDSVGVGEDGPTHQPVEHVMALRTIPGLRLLRPADTNETAAAWQLAIDGDGPTALILTRQNVPELAGTNAAGVARGAYALSEAANPRVVLIGTGSEVSLCVEAAAVLASSGIEATVVSMPSWDIFNAQDPAYRDAVLPPGVPKLSVEAGVTLGWAAYADASVGIDRFGASAPGDVVMDKLGINVDNVVASARALISGESS